MFKPVERHLNAQFFVRQELKIGSKIVDVFGLSRNGNKCIAVELKVSNWRKALKQAATYQVFADQSYVALHRSRVLPALKQKELFNEMGVGLMSVKRDVVVEIEAKQSTFINEGILEQVKQQFEPSGR